jgi:predicted RNase H-like nuclease (RuvC/YqgF family)
MENNNGRKQVVPLNTANGTKPTVKQLMLENQKLKGYINQILAENQQLRNTWALNRANFLFKAIELKDFSAEIKEKSIAELEGFLFPKPQEQQAGEQQPEAETPKAE